MRRERHVAKLVDDQDLEPQVGVMLGVRVTVGVADAKTASTRLAFVSFAKNPTLHNSRPPTSISTNTDGLIAHPMSLGSFGA